MSNVTPARAIVRPRVICPLTGDVVLLEDVVANHLDYGPYTELVISGAPRSGKTTALRHLASLPLSKRLHIADQAAQLPAGKPSRYLQVCASTSATAEMNDLGRNGKTLRLELAPWTDDDVIEYLLANHRGRVSDVMQRLLCDPHKSFLNGKPELLTIVLDEMASDHSLDVDNALRRGVHRRLGDKRTVEAARDYAALKLLQSVEMLRQRRRTIETLLIDKSLIGLLSHARVRFQLVAERLHIALTDPWHRQFPTGLLLQGLIAETVPLIQGNLTAINRLYDLTRNGKNFAPSMAASLLHLVDPQWRPN